MSIVQGIAIGFNAATPLCMLGNRLNADLAFCIAGSIINAKCCGE
jgi:4-diphosphocytidyl-2C-methyl-D-erythritol kinase